MLKAQTIWSPENHFHIWPVNFGGFISRDLLGYAQFPSGSGLPGLNDDGGPRETDGIVVGFHYFGSSEKGSFPDLRAPNDLGQTTTHEVGHWLGLRPIWEDGACGVDDFCEDTPVSDQPSSSCSRKTSCGTTDMIESYMDYTEDSCMIILTLEQRARMHTVLMNSPRRRELVQ